ncbi:MAG: hypothetical protein A3E88_06665 [Legionellales bacterium RIFCSPHIGHO2_12_FULL_35_11]|nr:MAG: hypothetical protein A3E88_06665 [Legionellales bacterium RIFCSPHIGHO2_12_FULL_35_11]
MASQAGIDYHGNNMDFNEEDPELTAHKKDIRRKLEARLDKKRLKEELEDYEGEFDDDFEWADIDK